MQERIDNLEVEMANMQQKILQLEQRFGCQPVPNDFVEYKGALFQKKFGGGYREAIFCLVCGSPMTPQASATHFGCFKCGHAASFPGLTVSEIIRSLPTNPATT